MDKNFKHKILCSTDFSKYNTLTRDYLFIYLVLQTKDSNLKNNVANSHIIHITNHTTSRAIIFLFFFLLFLFLNFLLFFISQNVFQLKQIKSTHYSCACICSSKNLFVILLHLKKSKILYLKYILCLWSVQIYTNNFTWMSSIATMYNIRMSFANIYLLLKLYKKKRKKSIRTQTHTHISIVWFTSIVVDYS